MTRSGPEVVTRCNGCQYLCTGPTRDAHSHRCAKEGRTICTGSPAVMEVKTPFWCPLLPLTLPSGQYHLGDDA